MGLTFPQNPWAPGDPVTASRLNSYNTAIQQKFGNITNDDIAADAAISGSKFAVGTIPGDRMAAKTIAQAQLGLLSVGTPELIALGVTKAKIATATADQITKAQINLLSQVVTFSAGSGPVFISPINAPTPIPTATYDIVAFFASNAPSGNNIIGPFVTTGGGNYIFGGNYYGTSGFNAQFTVVYIART